MSLSSATAFRVFSRRFSSRTPVCTRSTGIDTDSFFSVDIAIYVPMYKYNKMQRKNDRKKRRRSLSDFLFSAVRHDRSNQLSVLCVSKQKVLVGANFGYSSIVEEQAEICFKDIGIVGDYDRCAVIQVPAQIVRNLVPRLGVTALL